MGKRRVPKNPMRPHEVIEEEEDLGIPGKLYFDKPKVISVEAFHTSQVPEYDTGGFGYTKQPPGPADYYTREGPVRLKSSHKMARYTPPERVHYLLTQRPPKNDVDEYIRMMKVDGFGEGAIVARRYADDWRARWHTNWGIITSIYGTVPFDPKDAYAPYKVRWFDTSSIPGAPDIEGAWAEDLIVIHAALDKDLLASIIEHQM